MSEDNYNPHRIIDDSNSPVKRRVPILQNERKLSNQYTIIFKTLLFIFIGQLIAFIAATQQNLISEVLRNAKYSKLMTFIVIRYLIIGITMLIFKRRIILPKLSYIAISIIFTCYSCISLFCYNNDHKEHTFVVSLWSFILIIIYTFITSKFKLSFIKLIGLIIALLGFLFILSYILYCVFNLDLIFFSNDPWNNVIGIIHGAVFATGIILQEIYLNTEEEIHNGLIWIGAFSFAIAIIISISKGDFGIISEFLRDFNSTKWLELVGIIALNVLLIIVTPFYIIKCSSFLFSLNISAQLYYKFLLDSIISDKEYDWLANSIGLIMILIGMGLYIYDILQNKNDDENSNKNELIKQVEGSEALGDRGRSIDVNSNTQGSFIDEGPGCSMCSAFSKSDLDEESIKGKAYL